MRGTTAGLVLVVWALFAGLCVPLALRHLLLDEVAADELAADAVEHTVNITAAARRPGSPRQVLHTR